ncbi:MAG: hypothetical protein AAGA30_10910, partial [Planctomycetota bacterium]
LQQKPIVNQILVVKLVNELLARLDQLNESQRNATNLMDEYRALSLFTPGSQIQVENADRVAEGQFMGFGDNGELILSTDQNQVAFTSGSVVYFT